MLADVSNLCLPETLLDPTHCFYHSSCRAFFLFLSLFFLFFGGSGVLSHGAVFGLCFLFLFYFLYVVGGLGVLSHGAVSRYFFIFLFYFFFMDIGAFSEHWTWHCFIVHEHLHRRKVAQGSWSLYVPGWWGPICKEFDNNNNNNAHNMVDIMALIQTVHIQATRAHVH